MNKNIEVKLDYLISRLDFIDKSLLDIYQKLEKIETVNIENISECKKMGQHIDFVENVYENVRHPLGFICKRVKNYTGDTDSDNKCLMPNKTNYIPK